MNPPRVVLVDANILLNFAFLERMDLLGSFPGLEFHAPEEVLAEILSPQERARAQHAIKAGHLREVTFTDTAELSLFVELRSILGMGEAACLALAVHRGALVASDEKRVFRREAEARLGPGRLLNTPGLLLLGIHSKILTVDEADGMKRTLESKRFRMKFQSFREFL